MLLIESKPGAKYFIFTFEVYLCSQVMTAFGGFCGDLILNAYHQLKISLGPTDIVTIMKIVIVIL